MKARIATALFVMVAAIATPAAASSAPANHLFQDAVLLSGESGTVAGTTGLGSGNEPGEPWHGCSWGASVWYRWTAVATGRVTFVADQDFCIAAYTGSDVATLTQVAQSVRTTTFETTADVTYSLAVDVTGGYHRPDFDFNMRWRTAIPPNDAFADRDTLSGATGSVAYDTHNATSEPQEPDAAQATVWFSWTAPSDGVATFTSMGHNFRVAIRAYTGAMPGSLFPVARSDGESTWSPDLRYPEHGFGFPAYGGTNYAIQVSGPAGGMGDGTLDWSLAPPMNDAFTAPEPLPGSRGAPDSPERGSANMASAGASLEPGEPAHAGVAGGHSIWFSWTAPSDGFTVIDTRRSSYDTVAALYTGSSLGGLVEIDSDDDSGGGGASLLRFDAVAGTTYLLAVDGHAGASGSVRVNWNMPPRNDLRADAQPIDGLSGSVDGTSVRASSDSPDDRADVWYRWTAPDDGVLGLDVATNQSPTFFPEHYLEIFTASGWVASDKVSLSQQVTAGTTYDIRVHQARSNEDSTFTLSWLLADPPLNDMLADATPIAGAQGSVAGSTIGAGTEPGEHHDAQRSIWYRWTAPGPEATVFSLSGSAGSLTVYRGDSFASMMMLTSSYGAGFRGFRFQPVAGEVYSVSVDTGARMGQISLSWRPPHPNDDVSAAATISGAAGSVMFDNTAATSGGSPEPAFDSSIWYRWIAPRSGALRLEVRDASFPAEILRLGRGPAATYLQMGSVSMLSQGSDPVYSIQQGEEYLISVGAVDGSTGSATLVWATAQSNDIFAHPEQAHLEQTRSGTNEGARAQAGEPVHGGVAGGRSVWFTYAAQNSLPVSFDTVGSSFDTVLSIYTGDSVSALTHIASDDDSGGDGLSHVTLHPTQFTVYRIALDGKAGATGDYRLRAYSGAGPLGDQFQAPILVSGPAGTRIATNVGATKQSGEKAHGPNGPHRSIWFNWSAPVTAPAMFDTCGTVMDTMLAVYTGTHHATVTTVAQNDDYAPCEDASRVQFPATAGTTYTIAVDGHSGASGPLRLRWSQRAPTSVSVTSSPSTATYGQEVTLSATVSSDGVTPQGSVSFYDADSLLGLSTLDLEGVARMPVEMQVGVAAIRAVYSGDDISLSSTGTTTLTVERAQPVIDATTEQDPPIAGEPVTIVAEVALPGGEDAPGPATGRMTFTDEAGRVLGNPYVELGVARLTLAGMPHGAHRILLSYSGDESYLPADGEISFEVTPQRATITLVPSANPSRANDGVRFHVHVASPSLPAAGAWVDLLRDGDLVGSVILNEQGREVFEVDVLEAGTFTMTATFAGDEIFAPAQTSIEQVVLHNPTALRAVGAPIVAAGSRLLTGVKVDSHPDCHIAEITFTVDPPAPGATSPVVVTADDTGLATVSMSTEGWSLGAYTVRAAALGTSACAPSETSSTVEVVAPGGVTHGEGTYDAGAPARFSLTGASVMSLAGAGRFTFEMEHGWRIKADVTSVARRGDIAVVSGSGAVERYSFGWIPEGRKDFVFTVYDSPGGRDLVSFMLDHRKGSWQTRLPDPEPVMLTSGDALIV